MTLEAAMELQRRRLAGLESSLQDRRQEQFQEDEASLARLSDAEELLRERTRLEQGAFEATRTLEAAVGVQQDRIADLECRLQVGRQEELRREASLAEFEAAALAARREAEELGLEVRELRALEGRAPASRGTGPAREGCWHGGQAERPEAEAERSSGLLEGRTALLGQPQAEASALPCELEGPRAGAQGREPREEALVEATRPRLAAEPAAADEGALLCSEFEAQVGALQEAARRRGAQLRHGQESRATRVRHCTSSTWRTRPLSIVASSRSCGASWTGAVRTAFCSGHAWSTWRPS
ncbi:unnamed protein product [Prorocentrum cordatum]|uniref:Uncharacterized protein n=1 Tax=Prorocentrum cordatum TaxID=2364126 RepID=A0ABN9YDU4_9DINO|nr:unnamed protein product [Polarella glacialis]